MLSGEAERRLLQDLLEYYQKFERPVANEAEAVQLKFGLTLQQIMDVVRSRSLAFNVCALLSSIKGCKNQSSKSENIEPFHTYFVLSGREKSDFDYQHLA